MARKIGAELVARLKHMNDSLMPITPSESDSPQPVAWAVLGDGFEYVSMTPETCVAWAGENGGRTVPLYATPEPPSTPGEGTRQSGCIVTRLRQTRANMIGTEDEQHYWDCHEAAAEIERLRGYRDIAGADRAVAMLAAERLRLTDAERKAIGNAILELDGILEEFIPTPVEVRIRRDVRTLRGLLERTANNG